MKSIAALAFLAVTVAAQSPDELRGQLPECALSCIQQAAEEAGCESGDFACECENQEAITASATACQLALDEEERCDGTELQEAMDVADQICEAVASGDDASATESGDGPEETETDEEDQPSQTDEDEEPSPTDDGDDAEESGDSESGSEDGEDNDGQDDDEDLAIRLESYGWAAAAAAAAVALIF